MHHKASTTPTAADVSRVLGGELSRSVYQTEDVGDGTVLVAVYGSIAQRIASEVMSRARYDFGPVQRGFLVKGEIRG